ncbi:glycosyltransferase family 39 protein [Agromyces humatus]|uniref:Glycosyltransferase family 39 protein n=1 Tax=Agromyces humatus TaxID=279573 RepID=A0ABN2KLP4_9MICO|nr:glycosyltransferase family 39 protein [Agromyces humatus]
MRAPIAASDTHPAEASSAGLKPSVRTRRRVLEWGARFAAPLLGSAAAVLVFAGAGVPSYWGDEAASVVSAGRPLPSLFAMLAHVDAVHGLYYLFLHGWTALVGTSEALVRLPSAVAIGFAVAGTVVLGVRLGSRSTGILAGMVLAVLPVATRLGIEARSYPFVMAAGVWLLVWLVVLVRRQELRWFVWSAYAAACAAALYLYLYLALLVFAQLAIVMALRGTRPTMLRWLAASVIAALLAVPILLVGISQSDQVSFLARRDYASAESVLVRQWFGTAEWFAAVGWLLVLAAVATVAFVPAMRGSRPLVVIASAWIAAPTAALLVIDAWIAPTYNPRYLSFCAPALAMLLAVGLRGLGVVVAELSRRDGARRLIPLVGLVLVAALSVPGYLAQRGPFGKGGADFRQAADVIAARASTGDAIVFDDSVRPSRKPRLALNLYPDRFAGLDDVALRQPLAATNRLWDAVTPLDEVDDVREHSRVWAVVVGRKAPDLDTLRLLGFSVERAIPVHRVVVYEMVRP